MFNFEQSERIFIGRIDITGNIATLDRVIRRQFFINEGDPINPNEIKAAVERIRALDLFSKVDVKTVPGKRQSEVYVRVEVEEKPTGTLSFGAGYSSDLVNWKLFLNIRKKLFWSQSLSFAIRTGTDDQLFVL